METGILYLDASRFYNEEAFGFFSLVEVEFGRCAAPSFSVPRERFSRCLSAFDAVLELPRGSLLTREIRAADRRRDDAYRGLVERVRLDARHFKREKVEVARQVEAILDRYQDPVALPYVQASGLMSNLVEDLDTPGTRALLATLGVEEWLDELKAGNDEFFNLFRARNAERAAVETGVTREARGALERAYRECVARVNAIAEIEGPASNATMIGNINQLVRRQRGEFHARKTRARNGREAEREAALETATLETAAPETSAPADPVDDQP
jgi:hypothetical protein